MGIISRGTTLPLMAGICVGVMLLQPFLVKQMTQLSLSTAGKNSSITPHPSFIAATTITDNRIGPFNMPIRGEQYYISQPLYDIDNAARKDPQLIASPESFVSAFENYLNWVDPMVQKADDVTTKMTPSEHARFAYLEMMKSFMSATVFNNAELSVVPRMGPSVRQANKFNAENRKGGKDWTYMGATMTGWKRLDNVHNLLQDVIENNIEGDYIETGVWRGGSSVFARAVITAYGEAETRVSYVCDSFAGLPPGDKNLDPGDRNWDNTPYLEVPLEVVANNFIKYGVLDSNVVFAKGFFNETMPPLSKEIKSLSVMRLDGDMYESTVDVLYTLYDKLSIGGYLIMDDWFGFPSRTACLDFFKVHGINPEIVAIDGLAAYWMKTEPVQIQYWRYKQAKFKPEDTRG